MGRKSISGGVAPGADRIELTFVFEGVRYRPTIKRVPSEANVRRARVQLQEIKRPIAIGTFVFAEEFPEYRYMEQLGSDARGARTCNEIPYGSRSNTATACRRCSKSTQRGPKARRSRMSRRSGTRWNRAGVRRLCGGSPYRKRPETPTPIPWTPPDLPPIRHQSTQGPA